VEASSSRFCTIVPRFEREGGMWRGDTPRLNLPTVRSAGSTDQVCWVGWDPPIASTRRPLCIFVTAVRHRRSLLWRIGKCIRSIGWFYRIDSEGIGSLHIRRRIGWKTCPFWEILD